MEFRFSSRPGRRDDDGAGTRVARGRHAGKFAMAIFLFVSLMFAGVGWSIWTSGSERAALMAEGAVQVVARVDTLEMERETRRDTTSNSTGTRTTYSYFANVVFEDQAGREQGARLSIGRAEYNSLQEGDDLPVRYAAADPSVVELREGDLAGHAQFGYWFMLGGLAGLALVPIVALMAWVRSRRPEVL
ncbi:MAG: hypothetical protein ACRC6I_03440 [Paracoccaceae bacterium]